MSFALTAFFLGEDFFSGVAFGFGFSVFFFFFGGYEKNILTQSVIIY